MQGFLDIELSALGLQQASALADRISRDCQPITAIYSSDLKRAAQTAAAIARLLDRNIAFDTRLRERNLGILQGLTGAEARQRYPQEMAEIIAGEPNFVVPEGESLQQQANRVIACLTEIAEQHGTQRIVVVSHGGALNVFFRHVLRIPLGAPVKFKRSNVAINRFSYQAGVWTLQTWGDTAHLTGFASASVAGQEPTHHLDTTL